MRIMLVALLTVALNVAHAHAVVTIDTIEQPDQTGQMVPTGKGWAVPSDNAPAAVPLPAGTCATSGNGISYHGGPIMPGTVNIYYIWYGNWVNGPKPSDSAATVTLLEALAGNTGLNGSGYLAINSTYCDTNDNVSGNAVRVQSVTDAYSQGSALTDAQIKAVVAAQINSSALPKDTNGLYFVLTSSDVNATSGFCTQYCGWHTHDAIGGADIKYSFVGNADRCPNSCAPTENRTVSPNNNVGADAMASVLSHELEEAISDPDLDAWYDNQGNENADKCAWNFGPTQTASNGSAYNQTLAGRQWLIQQNWENSGGGFCAQTLTSSGCPATVAMDGTPEKQATLDTLHDVRDKVLANTQTGQSYVRLFYKHAQEGARLLTSHPGLRIRARVLLTRLLPTFEALMAGRRPAITTTDLADIEGLMDAIAAKASPGLQADIETLRQDLWQGGPAWGALGMRSPVRTGDRR